MSVYGRMTAAEYGQWLAKGGTRAADVAPTPERKQLAVATGDFWPQDIIANGTNIATARSYPVVNEDTAFGFPAFLAVVRVISEDVAKLPLIVYRRMAGGGRERALDHPAYRVLHDVANPEMTAFVFRETLQAHLIVWGNCYAEIQRNGVGDLVALWPLRPDRMRVLRDQQGNRVYRYSMPQGQGTVDLPSKNVFHIPGLGYDGLVGYSALGMMRRAIALGLAAQEYGERTFQNNARPGVVITHPGRLSPEAITRIGNDFDEQHRGLSNAQRTSVLEEGMTIEEIGFPPEDAQMIETRKFQVTELARMNRLPPHKIGDLEHATFSNIEQQNLEYIQDALSGWTGRWEAQAGKDLIADPVFYAEHLFDALLKGDALTRAQSLWIQRQAGVINADEWREIENRNPLPNGDGQVFWQPLNETSVGAVPPGAEPDQVKPKPGVPNPAAPDDGKGVWAGLRGIGAPQPVAATNGAHP